MIALHLSISGRVQGVGYRQAFADQATRLGVTGWVRNRQDGRVEAHIQGDAEQLANLIAWARQGPPLAQVSGVDISDAAVIDAPHLQRLPTV